MVPNPLHPAVVHFPIVLMLFLPVVALVTLWAIRRGASPRRAWAVPFVVAGLLTLSSWVSVETGEEQSERVERVVPEQPMESHEELAEVFFMLSGAVLVVAAVGMLNGRIGRASRVLATVGAVGLAAAGVRVGHSGGQLVYTHGAASAYTQPNATADNVRGNRRQRVKESDGDVRVP
jgi:predicted membrane protein DUF2231